MSSTAATIASAVRAGELAPIDVLEPALARITAADGVVGAFRRVRDEQARAEARALAARSDLAELPLAGVPVAVKDVTDVAGEYASWGCAATPQVPAATDGDVVRRLRAAGAIIVGLTTVPELCSWPMSDTPDAIARSPWNPSYTAGGSSGGSAAAVAAGLVPCAHGTDGLGSVRLPAAMCGVVGVKPGADLIREPAAGGWFGMSTAGTLASTVADAALLLAVLADQPALGAVHTPPRLRIAVSTTVPLTHAPIPRAYTKALHRSARLLAGAGHRIERATPRYGAAAPIGILARWFAGPLEQAAGTESARLQPRTRAHLRAGRVVQRAGLIRQRTERRWIRTAERFFNEHDVLATPTLGRIPPKAARWHRRRWLSNVLTSVPLAALTGLWNLAGYPAVSVPVGRLASGVPIGMQLVGAPGTEARLLGLATEIEALAPWPRAMS